MHTIKHNMTLYWWTHWFWITAIMSIQTQVSASPVPFSSFETISTSLKSALIQNENSFQQTSDQQKIATGSKSIPLTFETSDIDEVFGDGLLIDSENIAKNNDFLSKPINEEIPAAEHIQLEQNENVPSEIVASLTLPNVNSTNNSTTVSTTMLSSVTESDAIGNLIKTTTAQTTKLLKIVDDVSLAPDEHLLSVNTLNLTAADVTESSQNDTNDSVEILMTETNVTEMSETPERKAKVLNGYSQETKIVNNISSRSTLTHLSQNIPTTQNDGLSSEALFVTDEDNGGITMNAGIISIICVGIIGSLSAFSIMFVYIYRRRFLNKPQTLSEPDSSGYIDDSTIRDNSDELYSLDNDSFLNSLEAMTIQNYWTDSVKHTKL